MALDLVVSGATGRMGRTLAGMIEEAEDLRAHGGVARRTTAADGTLAAYPEIIAAADAGEMIRGADALIDFSAPEQLAVLLGHFEQDPAGCALVVGTTGLDDGLRGRLEAVSRSVPVLVAANFSVGVNLLLELVEKAARTLPAGTFDIEITETHHRRKADAPSGTALALGHAAAGGRAASEGAEPGPFRTDGRSGSSGPRPTGEIAIHAVRGGGVAGEHEVHFLGERERVTLSHSAAGRDLFADGALLAARWLAGKAPGRYTMADVLDL